MRQLAGPSDTLSGGCLVRVEEAEGLMRPCSKPTSSDSLCGGPTGDLVAQRKGHISGVGDVPPRSWATKKYAVTVMCATGDVLAVMRL